MGTTTVADCFVIRELSDRGEQVQESFIDPVCEKLSFRSCPADSQLSRDILDGVHTALHMSPLCIAYIGAPPWNPNVMIEVGLRLGTGLPLIILCDAPAGDDLNLPFDIGHERVMLIPGDTQPGSEASFELETEIGRIKTELLSRIQEELRNARPLDSVHPVALLNVPLDVREMRKPENWIYVAASEAANQLFGRSHRLAGMTLAQFYEDCERRMTKRDYQAFFREQRRLVAESVAAIEAQDPNEDVVVATVPMVIAAHENSTFNGRAYLPTIVSSVSTGRVMQVKVLYLEVTNVITPAKSGVEITRYECPIQPGTEQIIIEAIAFKEREVLAETMTTRRPGVFLCYNRRNREPVARVYELLRDYGGEPWLDEESLGPGDPWPATIAEVIGVCQVALVFIDRDAVDGYQQDEINQLIAQRSTRRKNRMADGPGALRIVPVLLEGADASRLGALQGDNAVDFGRIDDGWAKTFVSKYLAVNVHKAKPATTPRKG